MEILILLNLLVYVSIAMAFVVGGLVLKYIRKKNANDAQRTDIAIMESLAQKEKANDKAKSKGKSSKKYQRMQKAIAKNNIPYKIAKHAMIAGKRKVFVLNRRYTIDELTNKNTSKDLAKARNLELQQEYYERRSEKTKSERKSNKYKTLATNKGKEATKIREKYNLTENENLLGFYEREIALQNGDKYTDHRTSINTNNTELSEMFATYVKQNYVEKNTGNYSPYNTQIAEITTELGNKTSVSSPCKECFEYGKIALMEDITSQYDSGEYTDDIFPITIKEATAKKGSVASEQKYQNIEELRNAVTKFKKSFETKYASHQK